MDNKVTFSKIELLISDNPLKNDLPSIIKLTFLNCDFIIKNGYIVIITDEKDELDNVLTSTGKIFPLSHVNAYKTYS